MSDLASIEKGVCFYLLIVCGIDSTVSDNKVTWPLSCLIVKEMCKVDILLLGFLSGLLALGYSLGKISSYRVLTVLSMKLHVKWVLFLCAFGMIAANFLLSFANSLELVVLSRFLTGIFVNVQFLIRKKLTSLSLCEGLISCTVIRKGQIVQRVGVMIGGLLSVFLYKTQSFDAPFFHDKTLLTIGGLLVLLELAGLFLILFIEAPIVQLSEFKNRYAELPEIKAPQEGIDTDRQTKESEDMNNLFQLSMLPNENTYSEDSQGPDEIKFYSPRTVVNKEAISKRIQSARPQLSSMFNFPEKKEVEEEGDSKKIHISFIDEEFEVEEEAHDAEKNEKTEPAPVVNKTKPKEVTINVLNKDAKYFRGLFAVLNGILFESVAVSIYLLCFHKGVFFVTGISGMCLVISHGMHQLMASKLMGKLDVYSQVLIFSTIPGVIFLVFPVVNYITEDPFVFIPFWILLLYSGEVLLPVGSILIADSVPTVLREKELTDDLEYPMACKALTAYFTCALLTLTNHNIFMIVLAFPFVLILAFKDKLKSFVYLSRAPYEI